MDATTSGASAATTTDPNAAAKLADAFQSLDAAVEATAPPSKKAHTGRSLYATLAKYGVKPKQANPQFASLSKSTPHLSAILARAATRTRKALPFTFNAPPPTPLALTAEYRPSSIPSFLAHRLVCGLCSVSWVVAGREGMSRDAANSLVEKQRVSLVEAHKNGCPWKTRQCDPSIYRIPLQAPAVMIREIKTSAAILDPVMQEMEVKHPLTANQLASLRATKMTPPPPPDPSEAAVLTALFGWAPAPPATERPRAASLSRPSSRATSRAGSPFRASTPPRLSRASTLATATASTSASASTVTSTPAPPSTPPRQFLRRISSTFSLSKRETTSLLHCALCQRRVGLWAFAPPTDPSTPPRPRPGGQARAPAPQRHFDLLKEHRSFCPYVVRSTLVPSLPSEAPSVSTSTINGPPAGVLEGWRAVLAVVLRYGLGQRQRDRTAALRRRVSIDGDSAMEVDGENPDGENADGAGADVDKVEAMVESVKARGGKELLRYVKGLLG
ncbi:hypothetical protein B0H14DRAFT_3079749 [Mycena olivaceomarginata]|nr:hypothetical protein B0H14DRAFT_3079749 [Mycena olivaceomarginata]